MKLTLYGYPMKFPCGTHLKLLELLGMPFGPAFQCYTYGITCGLHFAYFYTGEDLVASSDVIERKVHLCQLFWTLANH